MLQIRLALAHVFWRQNINPRLLFLCETVNPDMQACDDAKKAAEGNTQPGQLAKDTFYDFDLLTLKSNVPLQLPMINYDVIVVPKNTYSIRKN